MQTPGCWKLRRGFFSALARPPHVPPDAVFGESGSSRQSQLVQTAWGRAELPTLHHTCSLWRTSRLVDSTSLRKASWRSAWGVFPSHTGLSRAARAPHPTPPRPAPCRPHPQGVPQPPGSQMHAAHVEADPGRRLLDAAERVQGRVPIPAVRCQHGLMPALQQLPVRHRAQPVPARPHLCAGRAGSGQRGSAAPGSLLPGAAEGGGMRAAGPRHGPADASSARWGVRALRSPATFGGKR